MGRATPALHGASSARQVAFRVLERVERDRAWADRTLLVEAERAELDPRDRALATRLTFGTVQWQGTLDAIIEQLAKRPTRRLDTPTLIALRLGLHQLLSLDAIPAHAAVSESVELAKAASHGGHRLVNAVLRRAAAGEARAILDAADRSTPSGAALIYGHPRWVAELWWGALGAEQSRLLMAADNEAAELALRANTLVTDADRLAGKLRDAGVRATSGLDPPEAVVVTGAFDAHGSSLWREGAFMPQSRASQAVARVLGPQPGERVLDLCAAPGGKTTHLAALMEHSGEVVAVELDSRRAADLRRTAERLRVGDVVEVVVGDAREAPVDRGSFDRVLVDPPCSGLGTLRSRPDLRWRVRPDDPGRLAALQAEILAAGAAALRPGGTLVYSTCTISPAENERTIDAFLAAHGDYELDDLRSDHPLWEHPSSPCQLLTLPHRDRTDGFFIARLRRSARS